MSNRIRIYMTGVGGQGTLTATTLLARVAVAQGVEVMRRCRVMTCAEPCHV